MYEQTFGRTNMHADIQTDRQTDGRTDVLTRVQLRFAPHKSASQNVVRYGHTRTGSICEVFSPYKSSLYTRPHKLMPTMDTLSKLMQTSTFQTSPTTLPSSVMLENIDF